MAGCVAGIFSTFVGHPFDTVKVRVQLSSVEGQRPKHSTPMQCAREIIRKEGACELYKGLASPLVSVPLVNAIVFASYGYAKEELQSRHPEEELTAGESCLAGAFAGLANTVVVTPIELLKCRLQMQGADSTTSSCTQSTGVRAEYAALRKEFSYVLREEGVRGLWRGNSITMCREVCSYIGLFGGYEVMKKLAPAGQEPSALHTVVSGSVAGVTCWTLSYPQDVIKSHLQTTQGYGRHPIIPDGGALKCLMRILAIEGHRGLWRGYSACAMRAIPANGAGFLAYEAVRSAFFAADDRAAEAAAARTSAPMRMNENVLRSS